MPDEPSDQFHCDRIEIRNHNPIQPITAKAWPMGVKDPLVVWMASSKLRNRATLEASFRRSIFRSSISACITAYERMSASTVCSSGHILARMNVASSSASSTSRVARCPAVGSGSKSLSMRSAFRSAQKLQIVGARTTLSKRAPVTAAVANDSLADEIKRIVQDGSHRSIVKNATLEAVEGKEEAVQELCMKWVEATNKAVSV